MATSTMKLEECRSLVHGLMAKQTALGGTGLAQRKLLALVSSKVDDAIDDLIAQGPERVDRWLEFVAGFAAGLRSDGNPITRLPSPFTLEQCSAAAELIPLDLDVDPL